ncbi:hypothetical protein BGZ93_006702 [Podila epicladia]|nr:hypothetical protein BGZ93_006702 [Podila epicladia]
MFTPSGQLAKNPCKVVFQPVLDFTPFTTSGYLNTVATKSMSRRGSLSLAETIASSSSSDIGSWQEDDRILYRLRAVIVHLGSHNSGHFVTYRRIPSNSLPLGQASMVDEGKSKWWRISDENVQIVAWDTTVDLPPSYSILTRVCVIALNESDKTRLIATPPELVQAVRQAIHSGWGKIQREQDYAGAHEFKVDGCPWHGDGKLSVMCRRLLTYILRNMAAHGWNLIQAVDMSKKQMEKDSLSFGLGQVMDLKADMFSISFNRSDRIRF